MVGMHFNSSNSVGAYRTCIAPKKSKINVKKT